MSLVGVLFLMTTTVSADDDTVINHALNPSPSTKVELPGVPSVPANEAAIDLQDKRLLTDRPLESEWITPMTRRCRTWKRRRFCDGPLRTPKTPTEEIRAFASRLKIGRARTANHLLGHAPKPEWVAAVEFPASKTMQWPVDQGKLWRGLRAATAKRPKHKGVDIGAPEGTPVRAANAGMVVYSHNKLRGFGNLVVMVHSDASVTMYAHLHASYVYPGQQLLRGQVLGEVGSTGLAQGAHLHFEYRVRAAPNNPMPKFVGMPERAKMRARQIAKKRPKHKKRH